MNELKADDAKNKQMICIERLKIMIESDFEAAEAENFMGLGAHEEAIGYCEKQGFKWYCNIYGEDNISLFDMLAICYLIYSDYDEALQWYEDMEKSHPKSYQILYGKAVTHHNSGSLEKASAIYQEIIKIEPDFYRPYLMIAFIELGKGNN